MAYLEEVCSDPLQWSSEAASGALPSTVMPPVDWGGQRQQNTSFLNLDLSSGHIPLSTHESLVIFEDDSTVHC